MDWLTKDQILAADDIQEEIVPVPEWGGKVLVRGLSGAQRDDYEASLQKGKGPNKEVNLRNARAKLVVLSVVHPTTRERIFSEHDVAALGTKSASALQRVFDAAARLSGLSKSDLDELTENFDDGQSDGSTSD